MVLDIRDYNVVVLGLSFMFIFTAFQTTSMIEESILKSAKKEASHDFKSSGYYSLCIIYASFSLFNWIAPSVISVIGSKFAMVLGGFCYWLFIGSLFFVSKYVDSELSGLLYTASVVLGFGAAVIWTAQGSCLTVNSTDDTMGRNSGIFWAFLQCSFLIGSLIVYYCFKSKHINESERSTVLVVFIVLSGFGTLLFFLLRRSAAAAPASEHGSQEDLNVNVRTEGRQEAQDTPWKSFVSSVKLFVTTKMLLLNICFVYTGLELTFFSGVYGTSIGNTSYFSEPKRLIGLSGIFIGVGEILGGAIFGIFGKRISAKGRDSVVILGLVVHFVAFFLILLNLPEKSPNTETHGMGYLFNPSVPVAMLCAFLLGFGDSCFNTQVFSILGHLYSDNSASAFAIFKFSQSVAAAVGFFYSTYLGLHAQIYILLGVSEVVSVFAVQADISMGSLGTVAFFAVERQARLNTLYQLQP